MTSCVMSQCRISYSVFPVGVYVFFFFQAEGGIQYLVRSRGRVDVYKRQPPAGRAGRAARRVPQLSAAPSAASPAPASDRRLLYTSEAGDERSRVDLGGGRITKKKNTTTQTIPSSDY